MTDPGRGRPRAPVRMVHLGLGAFHRAHQAWYTQRANDGPGDPWGIAAFSVRSPDAAIAMTALDCRYPLVLRGEDRDRVEQIDAIVEARDGAERDRWLDLLAEVPLVTMTITEAGYVVAEGDALSAETDRLRTHSLPATAMGRLVDGLRFRRDHGGAPIALVSCDNLDSNGERLREAITPLAESIDPTLASWIEREVSFVSSMVDRITPAVDLSPDDEPGTVVAEPFAAWVMAGDFPGGRPEWERAGALFVDDVEPWEHRKLWLLNAGHTLLASLGRLRGFASIDEAVADPECAAALERLWDDAGDVLPFTSAELAAERSTLLGRFRTPRIRHRLDQIGRDTPLKLTVRVIPVIERRLERGLSPGDGQLTALASWLVAVRTGFVEGPDALSEGVLDAGAQALVRELAPMLSASDAVTRGVAAAAARVESGR